MTIRLFAALCIPACVFAADKPSEPQFQTSDRCVACHNQLITASGEDVSIGFAWRASVMANSSRDPYWQASVRRETIDHAVVKDHIEDECSICHMPVTRYQAKLQGKPGKIFAHLPFGDDKKQGREASDGVDCSICHQISSGKLGTRDSFNGGFVIETPKSRDNRPEYGPFAIDPGQLRIMQTSTGGFQPTANSDHIRKSELCATCHTLYTTAFGPDGKAIGSLPEQVPYQEWLHSDFPTKQTCQDCHMPVVDEPVAITRVFGIKRDGMKRHVFVAANFFMQRMLNRYRDDLEVEAEPQELDHGADYTLDFLKQRAARVSLDHVQFQSGRLQADVFVENLGGHKLPTAFPSRRSWLHLTVRDHNGHPVFESGALRPDGSITGNDNDADPRRYEPHYTTITDPGQVQIYEDILGDPAGQLTTGLLTAVRYLKDNRLLPQGFDKRTADPDIAVVGEALADPQFTAGANRVRYSVDLHGAPGPFQIEAELLYQPIGYRWAHNLDPYNTSPEPRRFTTYFSAMSSGSATSLARASAGVTQ
ncbi:MAG: hypothetical protein JWP63_3457 [Candidatus Solibacter sp.]|nr:hypothetical protein [Candidatus Solibacter sp.]